MKQLMIILASSLLVGSAYAQKIKESEVPAEVKQAFQKTYPNAEIEKWEKEEGNYEVEFEMEQTTPGKGNKRVEVEQSVVYTPTGELVLAEEEIKVTELPKVILEYFEKNVGKKVKEASKITDAKGQLSYEAEVAGTDYIFDGNGNFLRKEAENEKDDDDKRKD